MVLTRTPHPWKYLAQRSKKAKRRKNPGEDHFTDDSPAEEGCLKDEGPMRDQSGKLQSGSSMRLRLELSKTRVLNVSKVGCIAHPDLARVLH